MDNNIQRSLGRIEGELKILSSSIRDKNVLFESHFSILDKKVNLLETFKDNFQGRMTIIGGIAGFLGAMLTIFVDKYIKGN